MTILCGCGVAKLWSVAVLFEFCLGFLDSNQFSVYTSNGV